MRKHPYQMTQDEFNAAFPLFTELSPRVKWRLYRICNEENLRETGKESTYAEFVEAAVEFRWDIENGTVMWSDQHSYYIEEALRFEEEIPSDVLDEYPDLVEEHINKRIKQKRAQQKRLERRQREKIEAEMTAEDRAFWSMFEKR